MVVNRGVGQDVNYADERVEDRRVADGIADVAPRLEKAEQAAAPSRGDAVHVIVGFRNPELDGLRGEHGHAADAQRFGAVPFQLGLGNHVPDSAGDPSVSGKC